MIGEAEWLTDKSRRRISEYSMAQIRQGPWITVLLLPDDDLTFFPIRTNGTSGQQVAVVARVMTSTYLRRGFRRDVLWMNTMTSPI